MINNMGPEDIFDVTLFFDGRITEGSVFSPAGWSVANSLMAVNWFTFDAEAQVKSGTSLAGFGFDSEQDPGDATYLTIGTVATDGTIIISSGATIGPGTPIPEPGFLSAALAFLIFIIWRLKTLRRLYKLP
jgi:hypothetical protein